MNIANKIITTIQRLVEWKAKRSAGALGEFYRNGGNQLLYDIPLKTGDLVIDGGGFKGDWSTGMVVRYGCRSEIYEPVPQYARHCKALFSHNTNIKVHEYALGGSNRSANFSYAENGTSEFLAVRNADFQNISVMDVSNVFQNLGEKEVSCLKLNVEGGEYEILERLIETGQIKSCNCVLVQFHRQPSDWESRKLEIHRQLSNTHVLQWAYPMVWEKWVSKGF